MMRISTRLFKQIAILYQAKLPPMKDGAYKPMKLGGYSDSGADIACQLKNMKIPVVTPASNPSMKNDLDWVFQDTVEGIEAALDKGTDVFWLNTVLYNGHPIEQFFGENIEIVGQLPSRVDVHDDKVLTSNLLRHHGLTVPPLTLISNEQLFDSLEEICFPCVLKPLRGRGSQGVVLVRNKETMQKHLKEFFSCGMYGNAVYAERFLRGQEITITVMPPGRYTINKEVKEINQPWSLPAVKRFNHVNGIAPYCGTVAVMENSCVLDDNELGTKQVHNISKQCEEAFNLVGARAPIRIDCRADEDGTYWIIDLNMKPNITGPVRPHRQNQDSLSALAARKIGWTYGDLLVNMIEQRWKPC